jgi:hypothetical protein
MMSDFERAHPEWRIPLTEAESGDPESRWAGALDPAIPQVYAHRMAIFREVAEQYDLGAKAPMKEVTRYVAPKLMEL